MATREERFEGYIDAALEYMDPAKMPREFEEGWTAESWLQKHVGGNLRRAFGEVRRCGKNKDLRERLGRDYDRVLGLAMVSTGAFYGEPKAAAA